MTLWLSDVRHPCGRYGQVKALSRTYARATAGTLVSMHFDPDTALFQLRYRLHAVRFRVLACLT